MWTGRTIQVKWPACFRCPPRLLDLRIPEHLFDNLEHDRTSTLAQREPRSHLLWLHGQMTVSTPAVPQRRNAWILWDDGVEELMQAHAVAWTKDA
jgi:hypothetical protein